MLQISRPSLLAFFLFPLCSRGESMNDALASATAAVQAATPRTQADLIRPTFHVTSPAQWINDPPRWKSAPKAATPTRSGFTRGP